MLDGFDGSQTIQRVWVKLACDGQAGKQESLSW
jgi:hypothetical protein